MFAVFGVMPSKVAIIFVVFWAFFPASCLRMCPGLEETNKPNQNVLDKYLVCGVKDDSLVFRCFVLFSFVLKLNNQDNKYKYSFQGFQATSSKTKQFLS